MPLQKTQSPSADNISRQYSASPDASGYFSTAPPPATHHNQPPPAYPQQLYQPYGPTPTHHPAMHYNPPSAPALPPQVFLGFLNRSYTSVPVYGPPGAKFDWIGNVFVELPDGTKDWIGPYHNGFGYEMKNPRQRAEEDCCWTNFHMFHDDLYWK